MLNIPKEEVWGFTKEGREKAKEGKGKTSEVNGDGEEQEEKEFAREVESEDLKDMIRSNNDVDDRNRDSTNDDNDDDDDDDADWDRNDTRLPQTSKKISSTTFGRSTGRNARGGTKTRRALFPVDVVAEQEDGDGYDEDVYRSANWESIEEKEGEGKDGSDKEQQQGKSGDE